MPRLPTAIVPLLSSFASRLDTRTWRKAQWLLLGAVPARLLRHPDDGAGPLGFGHSGAAGRLDRTTQDSPSISA